MWNFATKRNALRERMLLAPETNPSEFVRRYLAQKQKPESTPLVRTTTAHELDDRLHLDEHLSRV